VFFLFLTGGFILTPSASLSHEANCICLIRLQSEKRDREADGVLFRLEVSSSKYSAEVGHPVGGGGALADGVLLIQLPRKIVSSASRLTAGFSDWSSIFFNIPPRRCGLH
jgi:hypothetical protein